MGVLICLGTQVVTGQKLGSVRGGLDWERNDPLLKGLDLSGFVPKQVLQGQLPQGFRILARIGKDPLLAIHEERRLLAFLGILPNEGLFRQPFFPILCLRFLRRAMDDGGESKLFPLPSILEYAQPEALVAKSIPQRSGVKKIHFFEPERPYNRQLAWLALALIGFVFLRVLLWKGN
jgi:hypothetical protein